MQEIHEYMYIYIYNLNYNHSIIFLHGHNSLHGHLQNYLFISLYFNMLSTKKTQQEKSVVLYIFSYSIQ